MHLDKIKARFIKLRKKSEAKINAFPNNIVVFGTKRVSKNIDF